MTYDCEATHTMIEMYRTVIDIYFFFLKSRLCNILPKNYDPLLYVLFEEVILVYIFEVLQTAKINLLSKKITSYFKCDRRGSLYNGVMFASTPHNVWNVTWLPLVLLS